MILPDFVLTSRINEISSVSGLDSLDKCLDKNHFKKYPYSVNYNFNSRGFRDAEWTESIDDLKNSIWCIGDSFTVGLGSPREHTWTYLLQEKTNTRCINVSMDGASNAWIARKILQVLDKINPKIIIVHWSYITRGENPDSCLSDEQRRQQYDENLLDTELLINNFLNFIKLVEQNKNQTQIIHSVIPGWSTLNYYNGVLHGTHIQKLWNILRGSNWPETVPLTFNEFNLIPENVKNEITKEIKKDFFLNYYKFYTNLEYELSKLKYFIPEFEIIDYARDGHHYDIQTADYFSNKLIELFNSASSANASDIS